MRRMTAKSAWSSSVSGVVALPAFITLVSTWTPESRAAAVTLRRIALSAGGDDGLARLPRLRDPHRVEAGEREQRHLRLRPDERRRAHRVLGRADQHSRAARVRRRSEDEGGAEDRNEPSLCACHALGYGSHGRDRPGGGTAQDASREGGRLPVPRRRGRDPLRREGEVAAVARPLVLPEDRRRARADPADGGPGGRHRGDRHRQRGRGAPSRAEPRQAAPAAVQRAAARRQVVPVHRGHRRGRVPAGDVHARAAPARRHVLRPVREREEGARDARRAQPRLPVPAVRGAEARPPFRDPVPRLPHRPVPGAVRRLRVAGGLPGDHRQRDRVPLRRREADPARARAADARGRGGGAVRGRGALPQPAVRGAAPRRAAVGGPAVGRHGGHRRLRRGGRPRGRPDLPAARRQDGRPALVPSGERRRAGRDDRARVVRARVLRRRAERAAADRRSARLGRPVGAGGVPLRPARRARRGAHRRARREAPAAAARRRERAAHARDRAGADGAEAAAADRGARGAARGAEPRVAADPDRVLRHLHGDGPGQRRLDGRLPGRAAEERALPEVRDPRAGRDGRLRGDGGDDLAAVRAAAPTAPASRTTRRSRPRRTSSSSTAARASSRLRSTR